MKFFLPTFLPAVVFSHVQLKTPSSRLLFEHRSLQTCEEVINGVMRERFGNIEGLTYSCSCGSSSAKCTATIPETCQSADCTVLQCVNSTATSVTYCFDAFVEVDFRVSQTYVEEVADTVITYYNKGVANVCEQRETFSFPTSLPGEGPTGCSFEFDGQSCDSCMICDDGSLTDGVTTRSIDCSNIDPDAVDTDCFPDTDFVDAQVIKFDASAECALRSGARSVVIELATILLAAIPVIHFFW